MILLNAFYMILCSLASALSALFGFSNVTNGDRDILLPFSSMIFVFYSLLIYLPEAHFKTVKFQLREVSNAEEKV